MEPLEEFQHKNHHSLEKQQFYTIYRCWWTPEGRTPIDRRSIVLESNWFTREFHQKTSVLQNSLLDPEDLLRFIPLEDNCCIMFRKN